MENQYSLKKIIAIWALSAIPMAVLAFVITPMLTPIIYLPPAIIYWNAINIGLILQFVLSLLILKREGLKLNLETIQSRLKYQKPKDPKTGKASNWLFLWIIPFVLISVLGQMGYLGLPDVDGLMEPFIKNLPKYEASGLNSKEYKGAWWLLGLFLITFVFNYFLGEELLYRGVLLPKMKGVFGKWDWLANGVLFGFYHLHKPQIILSTALYFGFIFAFPAKRFQSSWMSLIIHGLEGILGFVMVLAAILGFN